MNNPRTEQIQTLLKQALNPVSLEVIDDSDKHVGHAGAATGGGHFKVIIVADVFSGLSAIAKHQLVYKALDAMMHSDIHALSIEASAP